MSIGKKMNMFFILFIVLLTVSIVSTLVNLYTIEKRTNEAMDSRLEQLLLIKEIRYGIAAQETYINSMILNPTLSRNKQQLMETATKLSEDIATLEGYLKGKEMTDWWQGINQANQRFNNEMLEIIQAVEGNDLARATMLMNTSVTNTNTETFLITTDMQAYQVQQMDEIKESTDISITTARIVSILVLSISVAITIGLILYVRRTITNPLKSIMNSAKAIGDGDLSDEDITIRTKDELGQLGGIFNTMKGNIRHLIAHIQSNAEQLSASAQQLSASAEEMTATTEDVTRQATDTAETSQIATGAANESAIAMEETAQGVQRIAEASQTLHTSSLNASEVATNGTEIIAHARQQMDEINGAAFTVNELVQKLAKQTEEIGNMTQVITAITEQTNLLALNAAIEAARAGEHGKGFAVVADEVRTLAEESKASANGIATLTTEIRQDTKNVEQAMGNALSSVQDGVAVIAKAGDSFATIVEAVNGMTYQIQDVSATAEQLSASAEQVSASVNEIASGTSSISSNIDTVAAAMEEQSATMNEVAHVATTLSVHAQELQTEVQKFKV
ncbi:methyl-accepting chemotaxis protein [Metasolibacillus meyeri]|uniref:Methyl-accepting chemotaxis protein n=1 Tax=Metasolibacillus meyeri TaxID=1071052 RepID=A0AAW9NQU5_9BACL|nr:methyl-accepting chemotaxis protein [Metasolibacillus meyeri]MEC1178258.1 methyl-accepting chemotaxis protein [Metasolibacillus meyeri]